ncbi:MAG TPA: rhomboid family intramembrane serine protease [Terracidiphilus sp.]|nr:rhomboid family intramembrane serine protease [Terracidiphilus sp.]
MRRLGSTPFAFPDFTGATRRLVLVNLATYFVLLLFQFALPSAANHVANALVFRPSDFLSGWLWQPLTYSFVHFGILGTLFELLSIWFLAAILEASHGASWVNGLYAASVLGTAVAALAIYVVSGTLGSAVAEVPLYGCMGGIFGLLVAIGVLHGDMEFLMFFVVGIKAKYMAAIYALIAVAMLFGAQKMYAFAQLGGALAGLLYIRLLPKRGVSFFLSEGMYGMRNRYYRWKRRRAARKFEVYMRKQGHTVRFDGQGRLIDEEQDDKKHWN